MPEESEPRTVNPFKVINRGEDTVVDDDVIFADFSPRLLPAETPDDEEVVVVPKVESAPEPVPSSESTPTTEPQTSETVVPVPVDEEDGQPKIPATGKRTSSSDPKSGQNEPLA